MAYTKSVAGSVVQKLKKVHDGKF